MGSSSITLLRVPACVSIPPQVSWPEGTPGPPPSPPVAPITVPGCATLTRPPWSPTSCSAPAASASTSAAYGRCPPTPNSPQGTIGSPPGTHHHCHRHHRGPRGSVRMRPGRGWCFLLGFFCTPSSPCSSSLPSSASSLPSLGCGRFLAPHPQGLGPSCWLSPKGSWPGLRFGRPPPHSLQQQTLLCLPSQLPAPLVPQIWQRVLLPGPADTALLLLVLGFPNPSPSSPNSPSSPPPPQLPADPPAAPLPTAPNATRATSCGTSAGLDMASLPTQPLCTEDVPTGSTEEEEEMRIEAEELQGATEGWRKEPFGRAELVPAGVCPPSPLPRDLRVHLGPLLLPQPCLCLCGTHSPPLLLPLAHLGDMGTPGSPSQGCGSTLLQLPPCPRLCGTLLPTGLPKPPVGFFPLCQGSFPFPVCGAGGYPLPRGGMPCSAPQLEVPSHGVAKPPAGIGLYPLGKDVGRSKYKCNICAKSFGQLSNLKVLGVPQHPLSARPPSPAAHPSCLPRVSPRWGQGTAVDCPSCAGRSWTSPRASVSPQQSVHRCEVHRDGLRIYPSVLQPCPGSCGMLPGRGNWGSPDSWVLRCPPP